MNTPELTGKQYAPGGGVGRWSWVCMWAVGGAASPCAFILRPPHGASSCQEKAQSPEICLQMMPTELLCQGSCPRHELLLCPASPVTCDRLISAPNEEVIANPILHHSTAFSLYF